MEINQLNIPSMCVHENLMESHTISLSHNLKQFLKLTFPIVENNIFLPHSLLALC